MDVELILIRLIVSKRPLGLTDILIFCGTFISKLETLLRRLLDAMKLKLKLELELMKNDMELILSKLIVSKRL